MKLQTKTDSDLVKEDSRNVNRKDLKGKQSVVTLKSFSD